MSDLKQDFSVLFFQMLRTSGFTMNIEQLSMARETSDKLVDLIETISKARSIELIRKMQEAVGAGFLGIGKDVDAIEKRLEALETKKIDDGAGNVMPKTLIDYVAIHEAAVKLDKQDAEEEHGCRPDRYEHNEF